MFLILASLELHSDLMHNFFCRQVDRDCELLEQERIMDYSLLVGVHFREVSQDMLPAEGQFQTKQYLQIFL